MPKLKSIFGKKTTTSGLEERSATEVVITPEMLKDITGSHSVRTLKELSEVVTSKIIKEHEIEALLKTISDLLNTTTATDGRQSALQFLIALTNGQYDHLKMLRSHLFRIVVNHDFIEDLQYRIALLKVLTDDGKDISYCEQIGAFLDQFMEEALESPNSVAFLHLLVQIVHYNSSFLDKDIVCSIVRQTCEFCTNTNGEQDVESCLELLDATVRYGGLASEGLFPLIETLCRTVNIEKFCHSSWKLMRNLIGTKLGHTAVYIMCKILEDFNRDFVLLRGAVFFVGMSIWGSKRVSTLSYQPIHVLSSFKIALQSDHHLVAHEVMLSLQRLVRKYGTEQDFITWDIVMDIIEILTEKLKNERTAEAASMNKEIHSLLTSIEQLNREEKFNGSADKFFNILTNAANDRPVESIAILLEYYEEKINPIYQDWLDVLDMVLENYLQKEQRAGVRVKTLEVLTRIYQRYRHGYYEEEVLSLILPKYIKPLVLELNKTVRFGLAQLLSCLLKVCTTEKFGELLEITEKFLSYISMTNEQHLDKLEDIELVIDSLIATFKSRIYEPGNMHVGATLKIIIKHITHHYNYNVAASATGGGIRRKIFGLLLSVCANENHFMGITDEEGVVKYSVHAILKPRDNDNEVAAEDIELSATDFLVDCDFQMAFDAMLQCLKNELDWLVLEYVLNCLPRQLRNKNLYLYCKCNMNKLCSALCMLVNDRMYLNKIQNCPSYLGVSELRNLIFPILSTLSTYHDHLTRDRQLELVRCVEIGLRTRCAHTCVSCLTVCILEMQTVMVRMLPSILVKLSQISATEVLSIPILQFLSTLKEIPLLYTNFIEEQYMSIFAMALQYTDCKRYSQYIVTIAHQVIADWFTQCRLLYRKGFVKLIAKALKSSVSTFDDVNDKAAQNLHRDMTDVCLDMMARYSFSSHFEQPRRSSLVDSMLSEGSSQTWLIGNMLVTITTSSVENCVCKCTHCVQVRNTSCRQSHVYDEEITSMSTFQSINTLDIEEEQNQQQHQRQQQQRHEISFATADHSEATKPPFVASADKISVVDGTLEEMETVYDEEGCEPTAIVAKLTQQLFEEGNAFSPSEKLMFSRQTSRVIKHDNVDDGGMCEEDDESSESEDEFVQNISPNNRSIDHVFVMEDDYQQLEETFEAPDSSRSEHDQPPVGTQKKSGDPLTMRQDVLEKQCQAECGGWAEILIQRPTGRTSWIARIEKKESIGDVTLSELSLLTRSLEGAKLFERLGTFLQPVSNMVLSATEKQPRSASDSSSKSSSTDVTRSHRRRYSTGSIDDVIIQQHLDKAHDTLEPLETKVAAEKRPLAKSLSQPSHVLNMKAPFGRRRSSSVVTERPSFLTSSTQAHAETKQAGNESTSEQACWCPNFVFLQLFYSSIGNVFENSPILLEPSEAMQRALKILNRIPAFNTHKFGVLYADKGQEQQETDILSNTFGSVRYTDFLSGLGDLINLQECNVNDYFTGGLSRTGEDGKFAYLWKDDATQVIFHVATLMPCKEKDEKYNSKKLHIGNNFVTVIYDNTEHGYVFGTIKGQFNLAEIVIRPLEYNSNIVTVRYKDEKKKETHVISDKNLAILVRQLAIHTNMALVTDGNNAKTTNAFASNWLERLRQIQRIKTKVQNSTENPAFDFTLYT